MDEVELSPKLCDEKSNLKLVLFILENNFKLWVFQKKQNIYALLL